MEINNLNEYKFSPNDIPRCPNCNIICSLKLYYENTQPFISFQCENNHKGFILLKEYMKIYKKNSIFNKNCEECGKIQEIEDNFKYCLNCKKILCNNCQLNHKDEEIYKLIDLKRFDSLCQIHSNLYCFYCIKCKTNICISCQNKHISHDLINLYKFNYSDESKNKLEEKMKNIERKIKDLNKIKQNIISKINDIKESSELEIKIIKILLNTLDYKEKHNNLNYNIIQNLKNIEKTFKFNKIKIYDEIYKEGNNFISFLQNLQNIKLNSFKNNFKEIKYHHGSIYYLSELNDGRLISCSGDCCINIYKKDTFELQLSIKEHSSYICSFLELDENKIITCSGDNKMMIIKLIGDNKYKIEQILNGHKNTVCKIIQIKKNELVSISRDKTLKIWILNNKNKFECITSIYFQNTENDCNILKLNENEFITSSYNDKCLKFWNSQIYINISNIKNIESSWTWGNMCLLNDDILCVGGCNFYFYLIKISNHESINKIFGPKIIWSIIKCLDGLILCSIYDENKKNSLVKYKFEENTFTEIFIKENAHNIYIFSSIEMNNGTIISGSKDGLIKLWCD